MCVYIYTYTHFSNSPGVANGHERLFREEKTVLKHDWKFLPKQQKMHILNAGSYNYEFEMILPGDIPESTYAANFYTVQYQLKATIERSTFLLPNISTRKLIHLSRQLLPFTAEFLEPISVANQWASKLDYDFSLPTKIYTHGDQIPVSIRITPLVDSFKVRHLTCTLKEYMICKNTAVQGFLNTRSRTQGRVLFSVRDDKFGATNANRSGHFVEWSKLQTIPLPLSPQELQCDIQNESIRIKHKLKFVLSLMNSDGHISELRASLPVIICALNNTGLPAYGETWRTLPYHPEAMLALLYQQTIDTRYSLPSYNSICDLEDQQSQSSTNNNNIPLPPTYDEITPWLVSN